MDTKENGENLQHLLQQLRIEHRNLDQVIGQLSSDLFVDQLQLRRLKKRKLQLKDFIARIESRMIPDLDA
ncbi:MAG: YdcH family protein [Gammaproteobacteria bacterium]|nr:YdcH family protein [Gammaproteobacteria bacterium]